MLFYAAAAVAEVAVPSSAPQSTQQQGQGVVAKHWQEDVRKPVFVVCELLVWKDPLAFVGKNIDAAEAEAEEAAAEAVVDH